MQALSLRILAITGLSLIAAGAMALGQPPRAVVLARGCVAEISIQPTGDECRIMWHILLAKVARDLDRVVPLMRSYNTLFKRPASSRRWVLELDDSGQPPASLPGDLRWAGRHAVWWARMVEAARAFERRPGRHPCPKANHYGGTPGDGVHADDPVPWCWRRIDCGPTAQAYWYRPRGGCPAAIPASTASGG